MLAPIVRLVPRVLAPITDRLGPIAYASFGARVTVSVPERRARYSPRRSSTAHETAACCSPTTPPPYLPKDTLCGPIDLGKAAHTLSVAEHRASHSEHACPWTLTVRDQANLRRYTTALSRDARSQNARSPNSWMVTPLRRCGAALSRASR
jgi:hypothetical protein